MARTAAVYLVPALLIAIGWLRLEEPRMQGADWLLLLLLALAPAGHIEGQSLIGAQADILPAGWPAHLNRNSVIVAGLHDHRHPLLADLFDV